MISIKDLNKNTYPGTSFFLDKENNLWIDLNIVNKLKRTPPVKLGSMNDISKGNYEPRPLESFEQTDSVFNFLKNRIYEEVEKADNAINAHIKQYPNAQAFKKKLPPEITVGKRETPGDFIIETDNPIVKQNINRLNKYLFNFITKLATGEIDKKTRVKNKDVMKILNKKNFIAQFRQKKENQKHLKSEVGLLVKNFNMTVEDLIINEKFLNFIKDNKSVLNTIINTPNKDRKKLIELADERLAGREQLKEKKKEALSQYNKYAEEVAKNILSISINKIRSKSQRDVGISNIVQSLASYKLKSKDKD